MRKVGWSGQPRCILSSRSRHVSVAQLCAKCTCIVLCDNDAQLVRTRGQCGRCRRVPPRRACVPGWPVAARMHLRHHCHLHPHVSAPGACGRIPARSDLFLGSGPTCQCAARTGLDGLDSWSQQSHGKQLVVTDLPVPRTFGPKVCWLVLRPTIQVL